ncbi:MAG: S8 family peptidase [Anaerocolumna sp.]
MNVDDRKKIISDEFTDIIVEYTNDVEDLLEYQNDTINIADSKYAVIYYPAARMPQKLDLENSYAIMPKLFGLVDTPSLEEMGVTKVQGTSVLNLRGEGVLLGFVDTGIEYTNPIFKNADNTTRIVSLWDQTIENMQASSDIFYYGTEYSREQINEALKNENPLSVIPSTDEIGHGTTMAGLAGGTRIEESDFVGVAPLVEYVIVKLKLAKSNIKRFFSVPEGTICYQENDIIFGIRYLLNVSRRLNKPIAICIGMGTNQGAHDMRGTLSDMISIDSNRAGVAVTIAAGNEGNSGHHYFGIIDKNLGHDTVELMVAENEEGFTMELWGNAPGIYSIDMISPSGEYIPRIPARLAETRVINFMFERTTVYVDYFVVEAQSGDELILLRFKSPAPGVWKFKVYGAGDLTAGFHIWLPMRGFIREGTAFLNPNPDTTIVIPGNTAFAVTVTAYDYKTQGIFYEASRGYSRNLIIKPDVASPGVGIYCPVPGNAFEGKSGTSLAAALTTGVSAMLLEWGIVRGNFPSMDAIDVKKFLIRGVRRDPNLVYPNTVWGFGIMDIYRTFASLRGEL